MRVVDNVVMAAIEATGLDLHDGLVEADNSSNVVTYELPYAVYYSSVGDDPPTAENMRMTGQRGRRSIFFAITYVGLDRNQTKWAGEKIRAALQGKRFAIPGYRSWPVWLEESQRIRRDDDAIRPDGSPLFYGVDNFAISIALNHGGVTDA